jgi:hypothetical protein
MMNKTRVGPRRVIGLRAIPMVRAVGAWLPSAFASYRLKPDCASAIVARSPSRRQRAPVAASALRPFRSLKFFGRFPQSGRRNLRAPLSGAPFTLPCVPRHRQKRIRYELILALGAQLDSERPDGLWRSFSEKCTIARGVYVAERLLNRYKLEKQS